MTPQIAQDLMTFSLAKHSKAEEIRTIYLKLAKKHHPDVKIAEYEKQHGMPASEETRSRIEEKFKELSSAYERLQEWAKVRDETMAISIEEEELDLHAYPTNMTFRQMARDVERRKTAENFDSKELTETLGKLRLQGKSKQIDKQKILEQMIQEEMALRLP